MWTSYSIGSGRSDQVRDILAAHIPEPGDESMLWWVAALTCRSGHRGMRLSEIDRHHRRAEVGFLFTKAYWGQGYAREAMKRAAACARTSSATAGAATVSSMGGCATDGSGRR